MVTPKTLKKNKERLDKLLEKENKEDERHYKMLKKILQILNGRLIATIRI